MKKNKLGHSTLETAPVILGGNVFGWTADEKRSFEILDAFAAAGFNCIDTADIYSRWAPGNKGGESETIIGKWLKKSGNREKVIIATKTGGDTGKGKPDLSARHVLQAAEDSLKRLQTDYIDLYQSHFDDETTPADETLEAYARLVKEGKVQFIGASNLSAARIEESLKVSEQKKYPRYETVQPLYNLYDREKFEKEYQPLCLAHNLSAITYFSLANGFLTGKYRSVKDTHKSQRGDRAIKYFTPKGFRILDALDKVSEQYNAKLAQIAIAWLIAQPAVAAAIASATSVEQLNDLIAGANIELDKNALDELTRAGED